MIVRIVKMTFREEEVPEFLANFHEHKARIRAFSGCERLLLLKDLNKPNIYFTYSWWHSEEDLERYRHSSLFKGVWAFTKALFAEKAEAWSTEEIEALR
ncbi:MAG: antibiotic biosynthesis monooxygenase [Bacteroidetes bacterium]|nr:antibiotic biosynthesis monooxygenase [Bacteroidota bacterium]